MIPTEIVLSPETYQEIVEERELSGIDSRKNKRLMLEDYFSMLVSIRQENTDVIIAKELYPNPCPVCGRRIPFLRDMIERLESRTTNKIRCPIGHRYEGQIKVYYLNILQTAEDSPKPKAIEKCPACGGQNIQLLGPREVFCLDCEWDNLESI